MLIKYKNSETAFGLPYFKIIINYRIKTGLCDHS